MIIKITGEQQREAGIEMIGSLPLDPVKQIEITDWKENRSLAQNRLYWKWVTQYAGEAGLIKEEAHKLFKGELLIRIYERDNPSYGVLMQSIRKV